MNNRSWNWCAVTCSLSVGWLLALSGCGPSDSRSSSTATDPFVSASNEAEDPAERPYIEASRPILEAIAHRDYATLFDHVSAHALKRVQPVQFGPLDEQQERRQATPPIVDMTKEQFLEMMGQMEQRLFVPKSVDHLYVQTIDPDELAGKASAMDNMFNIGAMSPEIPFEIRKASIRAQVRCQPTEAMIQEIADELNISPDQVRSGHLPENNIYDEDFEPYLNVKLVLVEDAGQLKIGYFEFLPPSMMD